MPKSSPRQVAKAIIVDQGEALILHLEPVERKRKGIDEWHIPGGSMEPEDKGDLEVAAKRETREEVGLEIDIVRELGHAVWHAFYEGQPADFEATFFEATLSAGQSRDDMVVDTDEAEEAAWIGLGDFDRYPGLTEEAKKFITMVLTPSANIIEEGI